METSQQADAAAAAVATVMENGMEKCQQRISPLTENGEKCQQQRISPLMENGEKCQQQRISPLRGGMTQPEIVSNTISPLMENGEKCQQQQRISPLRGGMTQPEIVSNTKVVRNGLHALRDDHYTILANIRDEYENQKNNSHHDTKEAAEAAEAAGNAMCTGATAGSPTNGKSVSGLGQPTSSVLEARITNVTRSLEQLEVGIAESSVLLSLNDHFERLEADRSTLRLEMGRVQDENEWLREELSDTQKQLQEALAELAGIKEEKKQWQFQEEIRNMSEAPPSAVLRPVTPSKIPVGSWRVDEEKDINRALSGSDPGPGGLAGSGPRSRATSPNPSRIPVGGWRNKLSVYKRVIEKQEATTEAAKKKNATVVRKSNYFKLNAPTRAPKIPTR